MSSKYFMKTILITGFLFLCGSCQPTQEKPPSFILIRHAEKMIASGNDPQLSSKGWQRANALVTIFEAVGIDAIYASPYLRAIDTAKPLAAAKQLEILNYAPDQLDKFAQKLLATYKGETVVIVGHSNTTPRLVNALSGTDYPDLDESEYDWIYFVEMSPEGTSNVKKIQIQM